MNHCKQSSWAPEQDKTSILQHLKRNKWVQSLALFWALSSSALSTTSCDGKKPDHQIEIASEIPNYREGEARFAQAQKWPREELAPGVKVIRDIGMTFYIVEKGDNLYSIRRKLSKIPEFSYLSDQSYIPTDHSRNIKSFNIPAQNLVPGLFIPIPLSKEQREVSDEAFYHMSLQAVEELSEHKLYGEDIKELINAVGKEAIARTMCAYARAETAQDWKHFSDQIGAVTLHRWEPHMQAFSFSHYHILMEKNADRKSPWPGLKARKNLGLSEGQTYHPVNGGKLFLAYWIEKNKTLNKDNKLNLANIFRIKNLKEAQKYGKIYNGDASYGNKLWEITKYYQHKLR